MASTTREKFVSFINNRWLVFVAAMWIQFCAGRGYMFGSISPMIKSSLNYNQKELGVSYLMGILSEILPLWATLLIGYGWVWLIVTGRNPILPLWAVSVSIICASTLLSLFYFSFEK
ncbi:hypothetical protein V5N11_035352 [Cardamine amara subsp. amara]|uniref:Nodulin-like domain-containing protein n=1 Tax=Cardamine amara subsp. amara TaxID=228776 RepID=A0ABD1ARR0_CARAN